MDGGDELQRRDGRQLAATTIVLGTIGFLCGFLLALTLSAYSLYSCIELL